MAKMLKDEMAVVKATSMALTDDVVMIVTEQYHTETGDTGKVDRSKSFYKWVACIKNKADLKKKIDWYLDDANRLERGTWIDNKFKYFFCVGNSSENFRIGEWFATKLKKMKTWENGQKAINGWETKTAQREEGYNPGAKYVTDGYVCDNGETISITDKEALLKHVGETIVAPHIMKSKLPVPEAK